MLHLCALNTRLFEVCFIGHADEMSYSRCVSQFLEISSNTAVTCAVTGKRVNRGGGCEMAKRTPCKRKMVEDALARNQERETGSIEEAGKE